MTSPEDLLDELVRLADSLAPAVRPVGTDELLRSLTDTARQLFGAAACSLALLSDDETELVYTTAAGAGADDVTGMRIPSDQGVAGWVVHSGQPIAISDVASDQRFSRATAEQTGYVPDAILAVPVASARRTLGVLTLLDRDARRPGAEQDIALLALLRGSGCSRPGKCPGVLAAWRAVAGGTRGRGGQRRRLGRGGAAGRRGPAWTGR